MIMTLSFAMPVYAEDKASTLERFGDFGKALTAPARSGVLATATPGGDQYTSGINERYYDCRGSV